MSSARRHISSNDTVEHQTTAGTIGRNELDTHADTGVAGRNWCVIEFTGDQVEVQPYSTEYEAIKGIPIAKCATVWTDPDSGREWLLLADQMLWFGERLDHSLLNPNQIREFGIRVCDDPFGHESIGIKTEKVDIPFAKDGSVIYFESRVPTNEELHCLPTIELHSSNWDPGNPSLLAEASQMQQRISPPTPRFPKTDHFSHTNDSRHHHLGHQDGITRHLAQISAVYDEEAMVGALLDNPIVGEDELDLIIQDKTLLDDLRATIPFDEPIQRYWTTPKPAPAPGTLVL